jgi:hypothetical protein
MWLLPNKCEWNAIWIDFNLVIFNWRVGGTDSSCKLLLHFCINMQFLCMHVGKFSRTSLIMQPGLIPYQFLTVARDIHAILYIWQEGFSVSRMGRLVTVLSHRRSCLLDARHRQVRAAMCFYFSSINLAYVLASYKAVPGSLFTWADEDVVFL